MFFSMQVQDASLHFCQVFTTQRVTSQDQGSQQQGDPGDQSDNDLDPQDGAVWLIQEDLALILLASDKAGGLKDKWRYCQGNGLGWLGDQCINPKESSFTPHP